jgi:hypothetical protein
MITEKSQRTTTVTAAAGRVWTTAYGFNFLVSLSNLIDIFQADDGQLGPKIWIVDESDLNSQAMQHEWGPASATSCLALPGRRSGRLSASVTATDTGSWQGPGAVSHSKSRRLRVDCGPCRISVGLEELVRSAPETTGLRVSVCASPPQSHIIQCCHG